jgi:hypothetical protein
MWQQAKGRAISSSGLRVGALARDWARRSVARLIRVGGGGDYEVEVLVDRGGGGGHLGWLFV